MWSSVERVEERRVPVQVSRQTRVVKPKRLCSMVRQNTKVGTEWLSGSRVGRKEVGEETPARNGRSPPQDPDVELNPGTPTPGTDPCVRIHCRCYGGRMEFVENNDLCLSSVQPR